jgi:hypothetical protein
MSEFVIPEIAEAFSFHQDYIPRNEANKSEYRTSATYLRKGNNLLSLTIHIDSFAGNIPIRAYVSGSYKEHLSCVNIVDVSLSMFHNFYKVVKVMRSTDKFFQDTVVVHMISTLGDVLYLQIDEMIRDACLVGKGSSRCDYIVGSYDVVVWKEEDGLEKLAAEYGRCREFVNAVVDWCLTNDEVLMDESRYVKEYVWR